MTRSIRTAIRRLVATTLMLASCAIGAADPAKILHLATNDIDTFDPQQWSDQYSVDIGSAIFESLYEWDYLARPPGIVPVTAIAAPEISADGKTWTIRIKPGIYFTDDPAFRGKPRELVAEDYVYSIKRALDPNLRRGGDPIATDIIIGMRTVVDAARKPGAKFNYDAPVEGLRALDRYTLQFRLNEPNFPIMTFRLDGGSRCSEGSRGSRGGRHSNARRGNGSLPVQGMEAWLADRAGGQSCLSCDCVSRYFGPGACGARARNERQAPAPSRNHRIQRNRGDAGAAARVRARQARRYPAQGQWRAGPAQKR